MQSRIYNAFSLLLLSLVLSACGSSIEDTNPTDTSGNTRVGTFVDSPVSGLEYITSSGLTGTTDVDGEFEYLDGDTVTFSIGPIILGSMVAQQKITPFDLAGFILPESIFAFDDLLAEIAAIETGSNSAFGHGVNLLIFLQSLDNNNNPDDSIEIVSAIGTFFTQIAASVLFNQSTENFIPLFFNLFSQLVFNDILDREANAVPVSRDDAIRHFITSNASD